MLPLSLRSSHGRSDGCASAPAAALLTSHPEQCEGSRIRPLLVTFTLAIGAAVTIHADASSEYVHDMCVHCSDVRHHAAPCHASLASRHCLFPVCTPAQLKATSIEPRRHKGRHSVISDDIMPLTSSLHAVCESVQTYVCIHRVCLCA